MPGSDEFNTSYLRGLIVRIRAGDEVARDELIRRAQRRLEKLARKMLKGFPKVVRWVDTEDVLQSALMRLLRALDTVAPEDTRAFFGLAAEQIRRELIDLTRHFLGPEGQGTNHESVYAGPEDGGPAFDPVDVRTLEDLERWRALHDEVERLPAEEREVFGLTFYHGWTQEKIAELFGRDERSIRRYWQSACELLRQRLGARSEMPV